MEWKREKQDDKTYTLVARGMHDTARFVIRGAGGFCTVRHYFLEVFHHALSDASICLTFVSLKGAKEFAEKMNNGEPVIILSFMLGPLYR